MYYEMWKIERTIYQCVSKRTKNRMTKKLFEYEMNLELFTKKKNNTKDIMITREKIGYAGDDLEYKM